MFSLLCRKTSTLKKKTVYPDLNRLDIYLLLQQNSSIIVAINSLYRLLFARDTFLSVSTQNENIVRFATVSFTKNVDLYSRVPQSLPI